MDYASINVGHRGGERDSFTPRRYGQFARHMPSQVTRVLDVGCSTGRGGVELKRLRPGLEIVGLDCVSERIAQLPEGVYSSAVPSTSTCIPLPDGNVDAVIAGEFIEHLSREDAQVTLREFRRVLAPGGLLALTTPNPGYLRLRVTGGHVIGGAHLSQYRPGELTSLVAGSGFERIEIFGSGRVSRVLGEDWPMPLYGSYLLTAFAQAAAAETTEPSSSRGRS